MAQQSLYRRYRPRRFAEVRGQEHVVRALRNAVRTGTEGHGYLFSGPRGTGKTSTARILAKALNCEALQDGEPCGTCASCVSMDAGTSFDLFELDAASNNGVDAMRDLVARAGVASPGRTKVYILDEVHMLSAGASNALLKTLEEPPDHVVFVLATTDPQKVLPTIRSRTQHFDFRLLGAADLEEYVRWVTADAGLDVDDATIDHVVRAGKGSARDTLSALDQAVAAGGLPAGAEPVDALLDALVERAPAAALMAVNDAVATGRDPRVLAEALLASLRDAFLAVVGAGVSHLPAADAARAKAVAGKVGTATLTRAVEGIGTAIVDMRQAADPRIPLEVALIRLTEPAATAGGADVEARLARLEQALAARGGPAPAASPAPEGPRPGDRARATLKDRTPAHGGPPPPPRARPPVEPEPQPVVTPAPAAEAGALDVATVAAALVGPVREAVKGIGRSLCQEARVTTIDAGTAVLELANAPLEVAERKRGEIEAALLQHFGQPVAVRFVRSAAGSVAATPMPEPGDDPATVELDDLTDAPDAPGVSPVDRIAQAFPGATVVEDARA